MLIMGHSKYHEVRDKQRRMPQMEKITWQVFSQVFGL